MKFRFEISLSPARGKTSTRGIVYYCGEEDLISGVDFMTAEKRKHNAAAFKTGKKVHYRRNGFHGGIVGSAGGWAADEPRAGSAVILIL